MRLGMQRDLGGLPRQNHRSNAAMEAMRGSMGEPLPVLPCVACCDLLQTLPGCPSGRGRLLDALQSQKEQIGLAALVEQQNQPAAGRYGVTGEPLPVINGRLLHWEPALAVEPDSSRQTAQHSAQNLCPTRSVPWCRRWHA